MKQKNKITDEELISLINNCSLNTEEKFYWLDILHIMKDFQKVILANILLVEMNALKNLNKKILIGFEKKKSPGLGL